MGYVDPDAVQDALVFASALTIPEAAHYYREAGLNPVPLGRSKQPIHPQFAAVQQPIEAFDDCHGVGLACGSKYGGGLVCLDVDDDRALEVVDRHFGDTLWIGRNGLRRRGVIIVPERHRAMPTFQTKNEHGQEAYLLIAGHDTQRQFVAPPSPWFGPDGEQMQVTVVQPSPVRVMTLEDLKAAHIAVRSDLTTLFGLKTTNSVPLIEGKVPKAESPSPWGDVRCRAIVRQAERKSVEGARNQELFEGCKYVLTALALNCTATDFTPDLVAVALKAGYDERTALKTVQSARSQVAREDYDRRFCNDWRQRREQLNHQRKPRTPAAVEPAPAGLDEVEPEPGPEPEPEPNPRVLEGDDQQTLKDALIEDSPRIKWVGKHGYECDRGNVGRRLDEMDIKGRLQDFQGHPCVRYDRRQDEMVTSPLRINAGKIKGAYDLFACDRRVTDRAFEDRRPAGVGLQNGVLLPTGELVPIEPEHHIRAVCDFSYAPESPCGTWDEYFASVFLHDSDGHEKQRLIEEFIGVCLLGRATTLQKALMLQGAGGNGKGVLLDVVRGLFTDEDVSEVSSAQFGSGYEVMLLRGRKINLSHETSGRQVKGTDVWKGVITGDTMTGREIYQGPVRFKPFAGHIYSANELPSTDDTSRAFFRRFYILAFNRAFDNDPNAIRDYHKIILREREGIFARCVQMGQIALSRGAYTEPSSTAEKIQEWQHDSSSVLLFADTQCEDLALGYEPLPAADAYAEYVRWAQREGLDVYTQTAFGKIMGARYERVRRRGGRYYKCLLRSRVMS